MRILKKLILYTTITGAIVLSVLVVFGFLYQEKIVSAVKTEINKHLNAEIKVNKFELSFVSHFPLASISLKNVTGFTSKNFSNLPDTLFYFEEFALQFDVVEVFDGNYILNSIHAENGYLNLEIDKNGNENFLIFNSDTSNSSKFFLALNSVTLEQCEVGYADQTSTNDYRFFFPDLTAKGTFSDTQISTALYGKTKVLSLILDHTPYLTNELAMVDIGVEINPENGGFQVSRGFITLRDKYKFDVHGKSANDVYQFSFDSKALDLSQAESLIPAKHKKFISTYDLSGIADIFVMVDHPKNARHPLISGNFDLTKGVVKNKESGVELAINSATGKFDLGKLAAPETATVIVEDFDMSTNEAHAKGHISVKNFKHPKFKLAANGKLDLLHVSKMLPQNETIKMDGFASFQTELSGVIQNLDSITIRDYKSVKGKVLAKLESVSLVLNQVPEITSLSADLAVNPQMISATNIQGIVAGSETSANAKVENWMRYFMDKSAPLIITGNVKSDVFNVDDWVKGNSSDSVSSELFPSNVNLNAQVELHEFNSEKMHLANFKALVSYKPKTLKITNAVFDGYGGGLKLNFSATEKRNDIYAKGTLKTQNVDVEELLIAFDNFGQSSVTHQQTRGDFYSDISFEFAANKDFSINNHTIKMGGDLMLVNGELIENKLLYEIPSAIESNKIIDLFVNLDAFETRLHHIKFDTIHNYFTIENSVLNIPQMKVKTSALTIQVMGTHSFENELDYFMNFNLKEVLTKKEKVTDEYGFLSENESGGKMIYLHIYTKKGEIKVDLDKEGSKKNRNAKAKQEWAVAKSILKTEWEQITSDTVVEGYSEPVVFEYDVDLGEFELDSVMHDTAVIPEGDSTKASEGLLKKKTKKKKKKKKKSDFEDWDFEDDDY